MSEWINCSEEMPKDLHIVYISYRPEDPASAVAYRHKGQWVAAGVFFDMNKSNGPFEFRQTIVKYEVTHWHELPKVPELEDEE